jgi:hypothetical protein
MTEASHPTVEPAQTQTDTFAVFIDPGASVGETYENIQLIKRVEVPRYSLPTENGVKLSQDKQLSMAVTFAVTASDSTPDPEVVEGAEFMVLDDLDAPMKFVQFERNPAIAGCWNPNQETVAEFVDE